jgi:hypothetical protein
MVLLERPDVVKNEAKPSITFKETRDCLFKFFILCGVPFVESEKLVLPAKVWPEEPDTILNQGIFYRPTAKLLGIEVNGKPIYVFIVPEDYDKLDQRVRKKLILFGTTNNIIVFDKYDCKSIGLDISGTKPWHKPLTKTILRLWAKKLFQKVGELKGEAKSKFNLNDIYDNIEVYSSSQSGQTSLINSMKEESTILRKKLRLATIRENFEVRDSHTDILDEFDQLTRFSSSFIEELVSFIMTDIISYIDLRQNKYKDIFRQKTGQVTITNKDIFGSFLQKELSKKRPNLSVSYLGHGLLEVRNEKTFQIVTLYINPSLTTKKSKIKLPKNIIPTLKTRLVFTLLLQFNPSTSKINRVLGEVILTSNYKELFEYDSDCKLQIFDSLINQKYSLWSAH